MSTGSGLSLPAQLINEMEGQRVVLFLGAGASFGARHPKGDKIPDGDKLRDEICDKFLGGEEKKKPLATVAEYAVNESSRVKLQEFLRERLIEFGPADFHLLIGQFRWHAIATTNYDLIVENVYDPKQKPLQELVRFVKDRQPIETMMKRAVSGVPYLKLHGCIDHYLDQEIPLILAREQYARFSENRTRLFERLRDWGREFPIVFCGYQIADPHIQAILYQLFALGRERPMYYFVDPSVSERDQRYWLSERVTTIPTTFENFLRQLDRQVSAASRTLPRSIGGGTTTLRTRYRVSDPTESSALLQFLADDVDHVRPGMPVSTVEPREFYKGLDPDWAAISAGLDIPRTVTDNLVIDAVLASEEERSGPVDFYAVKGPAGNGKTIVLKRAAWMAAHEYDKAVLFLKSGGTLRHEVIDEICQLTKDRLFIFVDKVALHVDEIEDLLNHAKKRELRLTVIVAERDAEWNVRCEALDKHSPRDFPVRFLSEREVRLLLKKLEQHDSLGLLEEIPSFEDRVQKLVNSAQRQLLVALHEATLGKAFEDIVYEEYQRIIPVEARDLYLDICTLNRLGVVVRAGLIARVSGIEFTDFQKRFFKPLEHIVQAHRDKYIMDNVYAARHQHVAEMVFNRVLSEPERRYDQLVRIMAGMNLDYMSDRTAFGEMVRGHGISESLRSRSLGRAFYDAAAKIAPSEAFLMQQRGIFEMENGGDLDLAEQHLKQAYALEPHNRSLQHSLAVLARKQAQQTKDPLLRQRLRDRAKSTLSPLLGTTSGYSYGYHTAGQIALDELRDLLRNGDANDGALERQIVDRARDFEHYVQEGLQKFPLNEHLLALESEYRALVHQDVKAENALRRAFTANPRQDWIAIRLARTLELSGKYDEAKQVLIRCLQDNPASQRAHYEIGVLYLRHPKGNEKELVYEHLRRSFTVGDQNYEAQFWCAREAFMTGKSAEAMELFKSLRGATMPVRLRNEVRGVVQDQSGRSRVYTGEIVTIDDAYLFIRCPDFVENIFVHRTRVADDLWAQFRRGLKVSFTLGFNMRGPTAESVRSLR